MNNLKHMDACICTTFEERLRVIERLMQTSIVVSGLISSERGSLVDFNDYPALLWEHGELMLNTGLKFSNGVNIITSHEFLEKAGYNNKSQGTSYIRHHFI